VGVTVQHIGKPVDAKSIGEWVKANTIRIAEQELRAAVGRGFDNQPIVVTDGWLRKDYRDVKPFGRIEFAARTQMRDAVEWMLGELRRLSPVLTRDYQNSHVVWADGQPVTDLSTIANARRVMIVNTQPYAGKIEGKDAYTRFELKGGKKSRQAMRKQQGAKKSSMAGQSKQAPRGVYRVAIANLIRRYGKSVAVVYQPQQLPLGIKVMSKQGGRSSKRVAKNQVYPTVVLVPFRNMN